MEKKEAVYYWENLRKTFSEYAEKEENIWAKQHYQFSVEAIDAALDALKMSETGEPLTMEQLREIPHGKIKDSTLQSICDRANEIARKPAHIDREALEKPCGVCGGKTTLYQQTNTTKLFMNTFGKAATLVTECMACPPYADCCVKDISVNSAFKIKFCPECGRPLTEEARAELEKRLRELVESDRDGRCVVHPCKVGDKVFQQNGVDIFESRVKKIIYDCGHFAFDEETIGERVFLTRESAEAALKGEQQIKECE